MISAKSLVRFEALRDKLFMAIRKSLEEDGYCKGYEGKFFIGFPNYFNHDEGWDISLDCYIIGPGRHYTWSGRSFEDCLTRAEIDITDWIKGAS